VRHGSRSSHTGCVRRSAPEDLVSEYVVELGTADLKPSEIGGKGAGLVRLLSASFPVPPTVIVKMGAFREAVTEYGAAVQAILERETRPEVAARDIEHELREWRLPDRVRRELVSCVHALIGADVALVVRSNAGDEDTRQRSAAGQYETYLAVRGDDALCDAVVDCWRSFFSARALAARGVHPLAAGDGMAVLVQPLVDAECAGTAYSFDPVALSSTQMVVNAAWGLGAGVADATADADSYWVDRKTLVMARADVAVKQRKVAPRAGRGVGVVPVEEEVSRVRVLPDAWVERIASFVTATEVLTGEPQDLEWAIASDRLWVLQSRPQTGLPEELRRAVRFPVEWASRDDARLLWRLAPASRDGVEPPLEVDYVEAHVAGTDEGMVFAGIAQPRRRVTFNGRRYSTSAPEQLHDGDRRVRTAALTNLNRRLLQTAGQTAWDYWGPEVVAATARLHFFDPATAGADLVAHLEDARACIRRHWMIHMVLWEPPLEDYLAAYAALTGVDAASAFDEAEPLLLGDDTYLTRLIDGLHDLAVLAREQPEVAEIVRDASDHALTRLAIMPLAAPFVERYRAFIDVFGDRVGNGLFSNATTMTPTWGEAPAVVLRQIGLYLDPAVESPATARARARERREARIEELCAACPDAVVVDEFRRQLALARRDATVLEEHNHYIDQMTVGQFRAAALLAARALVAPGVIASQSDVFWLGVTEIVQALRASDDPSLAARIDERKAQHALDSQLNPPAVLGLPSAALDPRQPSGDSAAHVQPSMQGQLHGKPGSAGTARGPARLVPVDVDLPTIAPGDILVAEYAGPQWTPLFPLLSGLVLDGGTMGGHAIATAREYGLPAVISTGKATTFIRDGQVIEIDGTSGIVYLDPA
jgi:phosphohistidine swiveling domain-containing protein